MTMTKGEKAELTIEPEWGYGKKGNIDAGYPLIKAVCTFKCWLLSVSSIISSLTKVGLALNPFNHKTNLFFFDKSDSIIT